MGICDLYAGGNHKEGKKKERKGSKTRGSKTEPSPHKAVAEAEASVGQPANPGADQAATEALGGTPSAGARVSGQLLSTSPPKIMTTCNCTFNHQCQAGNTPCAAKWLNEIESQLKVTTVSVQVRKQLQRSALLCTMLLLKL